MRASRRMAASPYLAANRDRGESRDSSPPTPPYVRVTYTAVRQIKHGRYFTPCRRVRQWGPPRRLRSFSNGALGLHPFTSKLSIMLGALLRDAAQRARLLRMRV